MNILIFPHLGLGDHFVMNGYIHYLLSFKEQIQEIYIIAKEYTQKTLEQLYADYPKVKIYAVKNSNSISGSSWEDDEYIKKFNKAQFGSIVRFQEKDYILLNFGVHSSVNFNIYITNWADAFYYQANVDPSLRNNFKFPSDLTAAEGLYDRVVNYLGTDKYIVIHDDPERDLKMDRGILMNILRENNTQSLPLVYLGKNRYSTPLIENLNNQGTNELLECHSIFDYYFLLKNAVECHLMDSSIAILTNYIQDSQSKLYCHYYIRKNFDDIENSRKHYCINTLRNWVNIFKKNI